MRNESSRNSASAEASASHRSPYDNHSIYHLNVYICGLEVRALVNTWASLTHINQTMADYLKSSELIDEAKSVTVQTVNQRIIAFMQLCELDVTYNNKTPRVAALVMPFLSEQLILGMDFLRQRQCQLRIDINAMVIEETNEAEMSPPTPSKSDLDANVNAPQSAVQYAADYLFAGIVIQRPKKYQRRLQFVIHIHTGDNFE